MSVAAYERLVFSLQNPAALGILRIRPENILMLLQLWKIDWPAVESGRDVDMTRPAMLVSEITEAWVNWSAARRVREFRKEGESRPGQN